MFECCDCGALFSEPATNREYMGEFWGVPAYEDFPCCPHCKSGEIEDYED